MNTLPEYDWNDLDKLAEQEERTEQNETRLAQFGIVNRRTARAAGLRNVPRPYTMAVPGKRK